MQQKARRRSAGWGASAHGWWVCGLGSVLGLAAACGDSQSDDTPGTAQGGGIFGGTGGGVEAVPLAGKGGTASGGSGNAGGSSGGTATNECQGTPAGKLALLDNFDDGDNVAAFELADRKSAG